MRRSKFRIRTFSTTLLLASIFSSMVMSWAQVSSAESLRDPTQVPANMVNADGSAAMQATEPQGPVLQSVMLGAQYRAAVINGKKVKLGEKYEKATLIALSENAATLRNPDGSKQTLTMAHAAVQKTPIKMTYQPPKHIAGGAKPTDNIEKTDASELASSHGNPNAR